MKKPFSFVTLALALTFFSCGTSGEKVSPNDIAGTGQNQGDGSNGGGNNPSLTPEEKLQNFCNSRNPKGFYYNGICEYFVYEKTFAEEEVKFSEGFKEIKLFNTGALSFVKVTREKLEVGDTKAVVLHNGNRWMGDAYTSDAKYLRLAGAGQLSLHLEVGKYKNIRVLIKECKNINMALVDCFFQ